MRIFPGIPPDHDYSTIEAAVGAIARRARDQREQGLLESPWSLVELRPDNEDFAWLGDWMRQLSFGVAQRCLEDGQWRKFTVDSLRFSYTVGIGTLLLMSAVEVARRETNEHSLWATISRGYFSETVRKLLFSQGYPSRAYKDAIEQAARRLNLRHVFGIEGMQNWYDTIYLQFGFSRQGFMRRLPEWLTGFGQTQSIQHFLQGPMHSSSFCELWEKLRLFRQNNVKEEGLRTVLRDSPWVLPEWADDLVKLAKERVTTSDGSGSVIDSAESLAPFLGAPALRWDISHLPRFVCPVTNLAGMDLQDTTYDIVIAGRICGQIIREVDGSFRVTPSDEIELPVIEPQLVANLITADGQIMQSLTLQLWNENEDVSAFYKSTGQRFDPWKSVMRQSSDIFLLLAEDLTLEPPVRYWHIFRQNHVKLYYLASGWSAQTRALLEDQILWQPSLTSLPPNSTEKALTSQIRILPDLLKTQIFFGDRIRLRITLPTGYNLVFLRAFGKPVTFEQFNANEVLTETLEIAPNSFSSEEYCRIELLLGVKASTGTLGITRIHHFADLPITGAAVLSANGWMALHPNDALELEQARPQPMKIFLMDIDKWDVLEGDIWIRHLSIKPRPLTALSGRGAPLKLSEGVYNIYHEPRILAREVVDHGCLVSVEIDPPDTPVCTLSLKLSRLIEPDEFHTLHWWDRMGTFHSFAPEGGVMQGSEMWWLASVPQGLTEPIAIAIAYNGSHLGSWWDAKWNTAIRRPMQQDSQTIAALLRWFHLPVLSQNSQDDVRRFAFAYPGETLTAWLSTSGLPSTLQASELDDGWLSAVRTIFWDWQPINTPARHIITQLIPEAIDQNPPELLNSLVWKMLRVSPLLMGSLVKQWMNEEGIPTWGARLMRVLIQRLIYDIAEAESSDKLRGKVAELEVSVADTMKVDPAFVQKALIQRACGMLKDASTGLKRLDKDNIAIAMNVEPFRRLLGIKLLELITQIIS